MKNLVMHAHAMHVPADANAMTSDKGKSSGLATVQHKKKLQMKYAVFLAKERGAADFFSCEATEKGTCDV